MLPLELVYQDGYRVLIGDTVEGVETQGDPGTEWVPLAQYQDLCTALKASGTRFTPIPPELLATTRLVAVPFDTVRLEAVPAFQKLYLHQKRAARFILSRGGRAIDAGEMGSGKTATAIAVCGYYDTSTLIVCPSSLKHNWRAEFQTFADRPVTIVNKQKDPFGTGINVISYSLMARHAAVPKFPMVVLDESHMIKTRDSKRTKAVLQTCAKARHVLLLSGTPSCRPSDLFPQLKAVCPGAFKHFFGFKYPKPGTFYFAQRFCDPTKVYLGRNRQAFKFTGSTREKELHAVLRTFMVRTTKQELLNLPRKSRERVIIGELSPTQQKRFKTDLDAMEQVRKTEGERKANASLMALVQATAQLKLPEILAYVRSVLDRPDDTNKYILFAHHKTVIAALIEVLGDRPHIVIDGTTAVQTRQVLVDRYQTNPTVQFAILSIRAAGVGLNLYTANVVIFCELLWSEKDHLQAEDRAHRTGAKRHVYVRYLIINGSTDEIMWRSLQQKVRTAGLLVDNRRSVLQSSVTKKCRLLEDGFDQDHAARDECE